MSLHSYIFCDSFAHLHSSSASMTMGMNRCITYLLIIYTNLRNWLAWKEEGEANTGRGRGDWKPMGDWTHICRLISAGKLSHLFEGKFCEAKIFKQIFGDHNVVSVSADKLLIWGNGLVAIFLRRERFMGEIYAKLLRKFPRKTSSLQCYVCVYVRRCVCMSVCLFDSFNSKAAPVKVKKFDREITTVWRDSLKLNITSTY